MTDKIKNILIGLFVTTAVTLVIAMILFLDPKIGDGKKIIQVRFANIAGITMGTRVTFAGKPVGEIVSIREIQNARDVPSDDTGRVYFYLLTLKIDSSVQIYNYDEIAIRTTGLMGEKSIAIIPKTAPKGKIASQITDQILTANSIDPLENTFHQIAKVSNKMEKSLGHLDDWFVLNQDPLSQSIQIFNQCLSQGKELLLSADQTELVPSIAKAGLLLHENLDLIKSALEDDQLLQKIAALTQNLSQAADSFNTDGSSALYNIHQITRDIASGSGTIGKLISGQDFYLRLSSILGKGETLMNDINHYGLLFQYDKHWQRSRTKKANILKNLDSPRDFRNFFEGEVDSITTSLGRLTELLDRAGSEKTKLIENEVFKDQFAALFRTVQGLSDTLKLYNEGLFSKDNP
jgi:phospholipid/cholesterol/gamma-HCH transport system substrate-binding protein